MYYLKTMIGGSNAEIPLNDISVNTRCPHCGKEQCVPFEELLEIIEMMEGDFCAESSVLICEDCAGKEVC